MVKGDVFLVAGSLVSVSGNTSDMMKEDVVNSILFSRLHANSKVDRFFDPHKWYQDYVAALGQLKWKLIVDRCISVELNEEASFVLKELVERKLSSVVNVPQAEQIDRLICSAQQDFAAAVIASSTEEHAIFRKNEGKNPKISTVVVNLDLVGEGPAIYSVLVYFDTAQEIEGSCFDQRFISRLIVGEVGIEVTKLVLNSASYEKNGIREKVLDRLPDVTTNLVRELTSECDAQVR